MSGQSDLDNHANQLNPNNDAYWESRGLDESHGDWEDDVEQGGTQPKDDDRSTKQAMTLNGS